MVTVLGVRSPHFQTRTMLTALLKPVMAIDRVVSASEKANWLLTPSVTFDAGKLSL